MSYNDFLKAIRDNKRLPSYYLLLINFTGDILIDIAKRNQARVAIDLNMTPVKLSHLLPLLKQIHSLGTTPIDDAISHLLFSDELEGLLNDNN